MPRPVSLPFKQGTRNMSLDKATPQGARIATTAQGEKVWVSTVFLNGYTYTRVDHDRYETAFYRGDLLANEAAQRFIEERREPGFYRWVVYTRPIDHSDFTTYDEPDWTGTAPTLEEAKKAAMDGLESVRHGTDEYGKVRIEKVTETKEYSFYPEDDEIL